MNKMLPLHERHPALIAELRDELEPGYIRKCRLYFLWDRLFDVYWELCEQCNLYRKAVSWWKEFVLEERIKPLQKKLNNLINSYRYHLLRRRPSQWAKDHITDEHIKQARAYPIERLLDFDKFGKVRCINPTHEDRHPSMSHYNNRVQCWSCGWKGDSIDVFQMLRGVGFIAAVKELSK